MDMSSRSFGLCDCDNFFVSCERRCDPSLNSRPVAVLGGNDGCVVSRSDEVKAMGVPMGAPYFKVRAQLERAGAVVLSGRLSLYNEISSQVMERVSRFSDLTEVYSIDEAFFNLAIASVGDPEKYCRLLRKDIMKNCGVPVSIGISGTKTLAKLASKQAKRSESGVFWLKPGHYSSRAWMGAVELSDVWGIGRRTAERLNIYHRILSAYDFASADDLFLKKNFSAHALYTAWELRGRSVYPLSNAARAPKSIQVSRSFGCDVFSYKELLEAVSYFTLCAARQLRRARSLASRMEVFVTTSPFKKDNFYARSEEREFPSPRSLDCDFLHAAREMLPSVYKEGHAYKKAGVLLSALSGAGCGVQSFLFGEKSESGAPYERLRAAAGVTDTINREFGRVVIAPADNFGTPGGRWHPLKEHCADNFAAGARRPCTAAEAPAMPIHARRSPALSPPKSKSSNIPSGGPIFPPNFVSGTPSHSAPVPS